jgi:hypothetical protein
MTYVVVGVALSTPMIKVIATAALSVDLATPRDELAG